MIKQSWMCGLFALLLLAGCGGEKIPELAEVEGTLTINGQPVDEVRVTFMPDPESGGVGRSSTGMTDENGHFVLLYGGDKEKKGAVVGSHRVMLSDVKSINSSRDENPLQRRFAKSYLEAATTKLTATVASGDLQTIDLKAEAD